MNRTGIRLIAMLLAVPVAIAMSYILPDWLTFFAGLAVGYLAMRLADAAIDHLGIEP